MMQYRRELGEISEKLAEENNDFQKQFLNNKLSSQRKW